MAKKIDNGMRPRFFPVIANEMETGDVHTLRIDCGESFSFLPGQFNMLYAFGKGEIPVSMSGDPETGTLVHTVRAVGAVSRALTALKQGEKIGVRGPFGLGWPVQQAKGRHVLIVAGGLGLAPLRPVIYHCLRHGDDYQSLNLLYGTRQPNQILFSKQLQDWVQRGVHVQVSVDNADRDWHGQVGVVTKLIEQCALPFEHTVAFLCGPEVMMRFCAQALFSAGLSRQTLYLSMERNMKCAIGLCGHCQFGPTFVCKDGPVFRYDAVEHWFGKRQI